MLTNKRETHSEKGLKTLTLMGTKPGDWSLVPICWKREKQKVLVEVTCPSCYGRGRASTYPDGRLFGGEEEVRKALKLKKDDHLGHFEMQEFKEKHGVEYRRCPQCPQKKSRTWGDLDVGRGVIEVMQEVEVMVGYPVWAKGTVFDPRFRNAQYDRSSVTKSGNEVHSVCELCSKSIYGRGSYLVPVHAKDASGKIHGMRIGQDCAQKILGIEIVLSDDQKKQLKDSVYKHFVIDASVKE